MIPLWLLENFVGSGTIRCGRTLSICFLRGLGELLHFLEQFYLCVKWGAGMLGDTHRKPLPDDTWKQLSLTSQAP